MARHAIFLDPAGTPKPGDQLTLEGDEAKHAVRVKRLTPGDQVHLMNGEGLLATAEVAEARRTLVLEVRTVETARPTRPRVEVCSATPKGPRLEKMLDQLSQVGAASWAPMSTKLGVVDPRDTKLARVERIAIESAKQCGRPWALAIGDRTTIDEAIATDTGTALVVADAGGSPYTPTGREAIRVLVGPEGGLVPEERDAARDAGAQFVTLSPHVLRIETACVVAAASVLNAELPHGYHQSPSPHSAEAP